MRDLSESLKKEYGKLYEQVRDIINKEDPLHLIRDGGFEDTYDTEVSLIILELKDCRSIDMLQSSIYRIFVQKFDRSLAGSPRRYRKLAVRLCKLMNIPIVKTR